MPAIEGLGGLKHGHKKRANKFRRALAIANVLRSIRNCGYRWHRFLYCHTGKHSHFPGTPAYRGRNECLHLAHSADHFWRTRSL